MSLTDDQINSDFRFILSDLSATSVTETVTVQNPDGTAKGTVSTLRRSTLSAQELSATGWADSYAFSLYYVTADDTASPAINDLVITSDHSTAALRILNIHAGPGRLYTRMDLGDRYGGMA